MTALAEALLLSTQRQAEEWTAFFDDLRSWRPPREYDLPMADNESEQVCERIYGVTYARA